MIKIAYAGFSMDQEHNKILWKKMVFIPLPLIIVIPHHCFRHRLKKHS